MTSKVSQEIFKCDKKYYLDKNLTVELEITDVVSGREFVDCDDDANNTPSVSTPRPDHETWTRDETLFLISQMRSYIELTNEAPSTLAQLEARIRVGRGKGKVMWEDISENIEKSFNVNITSKRVKRKWQTLMDGFKKTIDNNSQTGRGCSKFSYLKEMTELLGDRHDVNFVVTATATSVKVHRPESLTTESTEDDTDVSMLSDTTKESDQAEGTQQAEGTRQSCPDAMRPKRKRKRSDTQTTSEQPLLEYFQASDAKNAEREERMLKEMKDFNSSFKDMFAKMIDKM